MKDLRDNLNSQTAVEDGPVVSVIMPVYNGRAYLDDAVRSVLDQTLTEWELIIADDGSTDGSYERSLWWSRQDDRIHAYCHPGSVNLGVSATRNLAIARSRGRYLSLLDCDDKYLPRRLEKTVKAALDNPDVALVYSKAEVIDEAGELVAYKPERLRSINRPPVFGSGMPGRTTFEDLIGHSFWVPVSSALCPRDLALRIGGFYDKLYEFEDDLFFYKAANSADMFFLDEVLVQYRVHSEQWNARTNQKAVLAGNLAYLVYLASTVKGRRTDLVSNKIAGWALPSIARYTTSPGTIDLLFLAKSIYEVWRQDTIPVKYKVISIARCFGVFLRGPKKILRGIIASTAQTSANQGD